MGKRAKAGYWRTKSIFVAKTPQNSGHPNFSSNRVDDVFLAFMPGNTSPRSIKKPLFFLRSREIKKATNVFLDWLFTIFWFFWCFFAFYVFLVPSSNFSTILNKTFQRNIFRQLSLQGCFHADEICSKMMFSRTFLDFPRYFDHGWRLFGTVKKIKFRFLA